MSVQGIRGAIDVEMDQPEEILAATRELLEKILLANPALKPVDMAGVFFTMTDDLCSVHPARAARELGWKDVPLMCAQEIAVPGSLPRCVRVMLLWNTDLEQSGVQHVYLRGARTLRPDWVNAEPPETTAAKVS
jgi:chorismate mutase